MTSQTNAQHAPADVQALPAGWVARQVALARAALRYRRLRKLAGRLTRIAMRASRRGDLTDAEVDAFAALIRALAVRSVGEPWLAQERREAARSER